MNWMSVKEKHMFRVFVLSIISAIALIFLAGTASAQYSIPTQIVEVIDGKTVVVAMPSGKVRVELQYIEVPEHGQELHDIVKAHLRDLVMEKFAEYRPKSLLSGHAIGQLTIKGIDVSEQMLRDGAAWHVPAEVSGQEKTQFDSYAAIEALAKSEKLGIWSLPAMQPAWEFRTRREELAKQLRQKEDEQWKAARLAPTKTKKRNVRANPAFGEVGALVNRYDAETRSGLLSTMFLPGVTDASLPQVKNMALDVTYYYKQNAAGERTGTFVFSAAFLSTAPQFLMNNDLVIWDKGKAIPIGKPKRFVSKKDDDVSETLMYSVPRATLERCAYNEDVYLKIGDHVIHLTGTRYLIYNMLQVTQ